MANFNKVILLGNLTRDPELSYLPSQTPVVEFGLAVNRRWRGQDGQNREETCFVDCCAFGKPAEIINQYMQKGRPLLVDGRLQYSQRENKDGQKRSKLRVVVENFQFLGGGSGEDSSQGGGYNRQQQRRGPQQQQQSRGHNNAPPQKGPSYDEGEPSPPDYDEPSGDDIPF